MKLPKQKPYYRVDVKVRGRMLKGTIVRNDAVEPHVLIIKLDRGYTFVLGNEVEFERTKAENEMRFIRNPRTYSGKRRAV